MSGTFNGFSKDLLKFYEELKENNTREWFQENKPRYREVALLPMCDFIQDFAERLDDIAPRYIADPRPNGGSVFRIHRDVRFSKDKKPYKEHLACQFRHQAGKDAHAPGYYLHVDLEGVRMGCGIWMPPAPKLALIRAAINENSDRWNEIRTAPEILDMFDGIHGDGLKTTPKGYAKDHPNIEDLRRKTFFLMRKCPHDILFSEELLDVVEETYRKADPFMKFMTDAVELPFQ
ncbi:TIGR02453 family protein [Sneathiella sp. P13V-1]|uniref:DUF2461 domain-containing protein n=1 Tax=Sneathiella sp. P13V-1 TaxID=2697366 RepID=UPI00187B49AB|nr:DUF2461 domain-containing protein [Sneathiella sp. P13V-1]MBE7637385.1 TIGR02453 family protein [Sneathiella sp. P13V-1]